jgi:hypothetical protein
MKEVGHRHLVLASFVLTASMASVPAAHSQKRNDVSQDRQCLECHGQEGLKSASGRSLYENAAKRKSGIHSALSCTTCHADIESYPHPIPVKRVECSTCHSEAASDVQTSVHSVLGKEGCANCHGAAHDIDRAAKLLPQLCGTCHAGELKDFLSSAHGAALKSGDPQSPNCLTCHGAIHKILAAQDPAAPTAKANLPATCGSCHADRAFLSGHQIPFAHPVESYQAGVHGRALAAGNQKAASCSDCHSAHNIYGVRDARSTINHWNIPKTCGTCHSEIANLYNTSVHGQAVAHGAADAPVCTDCHGDHTILAPNEPGSLVNPLRVSLVTCGRCHGDQRLDARYNLPADRVPTFANSFHGLAARAGSQSVANCGSCHGVHNIFPSSDPRSTVNAANLAHTCGACHAGASQIFVTGPIHVSVEAKTEAAAVKWIRRIYLLLIPVTIGFMLFHHSLDFWRKLRINLRSRAKPEVTRMNLHFRIAHWQLPVFRCWSLRVLH